MVQRSRRNRDTDVENRHVVTAGAGRKGQTNWEDSTDIYILVVQSLIRV